MNFPNLGFATFYSSCFWFNLFDQNPLKKIYVKLMWDLSSDLLVCLTELFLKGRNFFKILFLKVRWHLEFTIKVGCSILSKTLILKRYVLQQACPCLWVFLAKPEWTQAASRVLGKSFVYEGENCSPNEQPVNCNNSAARNSISNELDTWWNWKTGLHQVS